MFHKTAFKAIFSLANANKKGLSYQELEKIAGSKEKNCFYCIKIVV